MMKFISDISELYEKISVIGKGGFGIVYKALEKSTNRICALKIIYKDYIKNGNKNDYIKNNILREIEIMEMCKCNNNVELYDSYETNSEFILVLELCDIDLMSYILNNEEYQGNLNFIQSIFIELNNAFKILRKNNIIHRDIKPENILLKLENNKIIPKLSDFGISRFYKKNKEFIYDKIEVKDLDDPIYTSAVGTYTYMAPEIIMEQKYNYKCDLYSLGITLYKLCFLQTPYKGNNVINQIFHKKLLIKKSGLKSFDDLIAGLTQIDPENRIDIDDYFNHEFFKEDLKNLKNLDIKSNKIVDNNLNKFNNIAHNLIDIMKIPNGYIDNEMGKNPKIANIIYYDENIVKHLDSIHQDSDYFERKTPGAFILSSNIFSLNLVMEEIKKYNKKYDKRVIFNLIVTGSKFQKVMDNLIEHKYDEFIKNICIYCMNIEKYSYLKKIYSKIIGIYNTPSQVVTFIEKVSDEETKEFPMLKIINYHDYKDIYHDRHEKISQYYGDLSKESYTQNIKKIEKFIDLNCKDLRTKKDELIKSFKTFDLNKDLDMLDKLIIKEYTKNTLYGDLNNWLRKLDNLAYEMIAYFTARLMYSLNNYALLNNRFFNEKKVIFRGAKTNYINLLPFERLKGKIIVLSSFISTSENESFVIDWSGRKKLKENFEINQKFSVIYKITNIINKNNFSCGINIQDESHYDEKEILFQPFTFYLVKNVDFNFDKYTVDIELETIPKKEILEEKIKQGKKAIYNKKSNLILIDEN